MMLKKIIILFFAAAVCVKQPSRAEVDTSIGEFLRINPSVASSALGNAGAALRGPAGYVFLNPALPELKKSGSSQINTSYTGWLSGTKLMNVLAAHSPDGNAAFGAGVSFFSSGEMERFDAGGNELSGDFQIKDFLFSPFYGKNITEKLRGGVSAKVVSIDNVNNRKILFAAGIGGVYSLSKCLTAGVSLQNAGPGVEIGGSRYALPRLLKAGIGWKIRSNVTAMADIEYPYDDSIKAGIEWRLKEKVKLRCGYDKTAGLKSGAGLTAGLGFEIASRDSMEELATGRSVPVLLLFDYAFQNFGELGYIHRVSFGIHY
ncbi:MAG: PorV/PorQ family protein [bacterium]